MAFDGEVAQTTNGRPRRGGHHRLPRAEACGSEATVTDEMDQWWQLESGRGVPNGSLSILPTDKVMRRQLNPAGL